MDLISNYRDDNFFKEKFFEFTAKIFPRANFRRWHEFGGWSEKYIPFSYFNGIKIIANVSISEMDILLCGKNIRAIQFATVGTLPTFRNKGFIRQLIEHVLSQYEDSCELMFLYGNTEVLDFYPKFGFRRAGEQIFSSEIRNVNFSRPGRKLNLNEEKDRAILRRLLHTATPATEIFGAVNYEFASLWHIVNFHAENLWYIEEKNTLVVGKSTEENFAVYDIFSEENFSFHEILQYLPANDAKKILFYFTPDKIDILTKIEAPYTSSPLFIRGNFPLEDGTFKFPELAQT